MDNKNYTEEEYNKDKTLYKEFWHVRWITDAVKEQIKGYYLRKYGTDDVVKLFSDNDDQKRCY